MNRESKVAILEWVTKYSPEFLAKRTDEEIDRLYKERVEARNEMFYEGAKKK
jgi:hypothetical protein